MITRRYKPTSFAMLRSGVRLPFAPMIVKCLKHKDLQKQAQKYSVAIG